MGARHKRADARREPHRDRRLHADRGTGLRLWQPTGWQRLANELLHVAMPLLFLACWWLATTRATLRWRALLPWLLYPLGYLAYALARGMADGRYPYPFLDVGALGMPRVMANTAAVALTFVAVGAALAGVLR